MIDKEIQDEEAESKSHPRAEMKWRKEEERRQRRGDCRVWDVVGTLC